jgi:hypothetical protein
MWYTTDVEVYMPSVWDILYPGAGAAGDSTLFDAATGMPIGHVHHDALGDHFYGMDGSAHGTTQLDGMGNLHHRDATGHEFGQTSFDGFGHAYHRDALGRNLGQSVVDGLGHVHHIGPMGQEFGTSSLGPDGHIHNEFLPGTTAGTFGFMNRLLRG